MPFSPRFTITNPITAALTAIERARGFLEAATLSEDWIEHMSQRALLLEAHHTTHIEGTHLTLDEAARLWAGEKVEGADRDDVRELLNYRGAFNLVAEYDQAKFIAKARAFLLRHLDHGVVAKLRVNKPLTTSDLGELEHGTCNGDRRLSFHTGV